MFELPSKDRNITPEKRVNRDKCSFATKQRLLLMRSFAINEPRSQARALYATLHYSKVITSLNLKVIPNCSPFRLLP